MTQLLSRGFVDTFRALYPERTGAYSWWSYRFHARENNAGWRIDYFIVSRRLMPRVKSADIWPEVTGSDHCPVVLELAGERLTNYHIPPGTGHRRNTMERTYIDTLAQLIARSPTCYHAAATAAELLAAAGYTPLDEGQRWQLRPGGKYYMTRGGSALIAFRVPEHAPAGFRLAAAHGDSPCFKLKENAALRDGGYLRLNTEVYGGLRMSSWFDRPLSVAGRLFTEEDGVLRQTLVNIDRDLLVIPSVAIHFDRAANDGVKYRANVDTLPLAGSDGAADILTLAAESAGLRPEDVLGSDLLVYS